MLADQLEGLLARHEPTSVALVGCAGGNGFVQAAEAGVSRLVRIDINPQYVADAQARFGDRIAGPESRATGLDRPGPVALASFALSVALGAIGPRPSLWVLAMVGPDRIVLPRDRSSPGSVRL